MVSSLSYKVWSLHFYWKVSMTDLHLVYQILFSQTFQHKLSSHIKDDHYSYKFHFCLSTYSWNILSLIPYIKPTHSINFPEVFLCSLAYVSFILHWPWHSNYCLYFISWYLIISKFIYSLFVPYCFIFLPSENICSTTSDDTWHINFAFPGICRRVLEIK